MASFLSNPQIVHLCIIEPKSFQSWTTSGDKSNHFNHFSDDGYPDFSSPVFEPIFGLISNSEFNGWIFGQFDIRSILSYNWLHILIHAEQSTVFRYRVKLRPWASIGCILFEMRTKWTRDEVIIPSLIFDELSLYSRRSVLRAASGRSETVLSVLATEMFIRKDNTPVVVLVYLVAIEEIDMDSWRNLDLC